MNNIHNPCVKTFRAFHSKLFARTFSTLLPNQVCLHQEKPPPSRRMIREQCFHSVRPHNGTDLNKGLHWNRLAFTNQVAGCFLRGKEDKASFITTCDCREKIADKTGEANHDGNPDQHNRKHDTFSTVNQISNKIEQTNVTNKINRPENPDRERNRSKAIFASAHEEFREIQRKNATQSVPGDKVYSVLNRKGFNDDEEDGQNSHNQDDDGDSNSLGELVTIVTENIEKSKFFLILPIFLKKLVSSESADCITLVSAQKSIFRFLEEKKTFPSFSV